ncbi:MAG: hypothetical protein R3D58_14725 [Saprospiraceae bacterium]
MQFQAAALTPGFSQRLPFFTQKQYVYLQKYKPRACPPGLLPRHPDLCSYGGLCCAPFFSHIQEYLPVPGSNPESVRRPRAVQFVHA